MGIFKIFSRFIIIFFSVLLWFFLLVNMLNKFGINPFEELMYNLGISELDNSNTYFGFTSFLNSLNDFPPFTFADDVATFFRDFVNETRHASVLFDSLNTEGLQWYEQVINVVQAIGIIITIPIRLIIAILLSIGSLFVNIWYVIWWFLQVVSGIYNSPMPSDPYITALAVH